MIGSSRQRGLAAILMVVGGGCLWAALEETGWSDFECARSRSSPAHCILEHQDPPQANFATACSSQSGHCQPNVGSPCHGRVWGRAVPGRCEHRLQSHAALECLTGASTLVKIEEFAAICDLRDDQCECRFVPVSPANTESLRVCTCSDRRLSPASP